MKIKFILSSLLIICFSMSYGQKDKSCRCPKNQFVSEKYGTIFQLSNGLRLLVCGAVDEETTPPTYSEFIVAECGKKSIIDYWNEKKTSEIKFENDTLYVKQMIDLPVGRNFIPQQVNWGMDKIYYTADQVMMKSSINKKIKKYSPAQIDAVNKLYDQAKIGGINNKKMEIAYKLFIATISGNETARKNLTDFKTKFKIEDESEFADEYNELILKLESWDAK
jgi:hypothetical protein